MYRSIYRILLVAAMSVMSVPLSASFDEATKSYLLGDFEKARYLALVAATDGSPQAQMLLGQLYFRGEGVAKDLPLALYWYEKAASNNFVEAQYRLGVLYLEGKDGVSRDYSRAYEWLKKAADNGNLDAQPKMEALYKTESGSVVNLNESIEVLQQAADKGEKIARYLLSQKLLSGEGIAQDKPRAISMLLEDAKRGFVKAQKRLGELYYYGDGVEPDYFEAYAWSMAYAGTKDLGGLAREGKQTARSALRKLEENKHHEAYIKSEQYFEQYVLPFHKNAREVGPDKYRIVVHTSKQEVQQAKQENVPASAGGSAGATSSSASTGLASPVTPAAPTTTPVQPQTATTEAVSRSESDAFRVLARYRGTFYLLYKRELPAMPTMAGKIVLSMDVDAGGAVTRIEQVSSELNAPQFETRLIERIKQIPFSAKGTQTLSFTYPIEFLPPDADSKKVNLPVIPEPKNETAASEGAELTPASRATADVDSPLSASTENHQQDTQISAPEESSAESADSLVNPANDTETTLPETPAAETQQSGNIQPVAEERNFQEVYNVLVRNKSRLYELYVREYEQDKKLQGRAVFDIQIEPDGSISSVQVVSSDLESPTLEQDLVDYLKNNVNFGSKNVAPYKISYPVDFLPPAN